MENGLVNERVAKLEAITQDHKEEIKSLRDDNVLLHRLVVNQEVLANLVKESQEVHKETRSTLNEINNNLNHLNKSQEELRKSHEELKVELKENVNRLDSKVEKVEKVQEEEKKKHLLDISGWSKKAIVWAFTIGLGVIAAVITAYVKLKLGL